MIDLVQKPVLPSPFPKGDAYWVCPQTGIRVPKNPTANLLWRAKLLMDAQTDTGLQRDLFTAASQSVLFFVNTFVYTNRLFVIGEDGEVRQCRPDEAHVPFVTWEIQDEHIVEVERAITEGYDLLTDKARDMGATWDHLVVIHHQWLFRKARSFLLLSRKEDSVDTFGKTGESGSDTGTLFGKHDYINRWLPEWMAPPGDRDRKRLHLVNLVNKSRIDGESSNATAGSSDRRTAILLDEMAKMEEGEAIKRSTKDVTACRLANSTPDGPGTAYSKWRLSGQVKVFSLMYWDHPEKGRGRYVKQNESSGKWEIRSPWFDAQEKLRTPKEIAREILANHIDSGDTFFESHNVELHRRLWAQSAKAQYTVDFRPGIATEAIPTIIERSQVQFVNARKGHGPLRVWVSLVNGRLDQTKNYVLSCDISKGQGASNSVINVTCVETREKVAEWADANTPPYELARIACALALWVGGSHRNGRPVVIWEANGPGWDFGRQVVKLYKYPFYFVDHSAGQIKEKKGQKYGWHSSRDKKEEALGLLRRAYAHGGFINHSSEALDEALTYIYYDGGGIGPASLIEESSEAKKCHGDRVIADMLFLVVAGEVPAARHASPVAPPRSVAYRKQQYDKARKAKRNNRNRTFDFRLQETGR